MSSSDGLMQEHLVDDLALKERHYWWNRVRRFNLMTYLQSHLSTGAKILEIGCGTGANLQALRGFGYQAMGLELDKRAVNYCRDLTVIRADALQALPFASSSFDAVVILDVLEHLEDPQQVVVEMKRVVRSGGLVCVMVPADPKLWSYWDEMLGHYRRYTPETLSQEFTKGWKKIKIEYSFSWMYWPVKIYRGIHQKRERSSDHTDLVPLPEWINSIFYWLGRMERALQSKVKFPVGTSLNGVWVKEAI